MPCVMGVARLVAPPDRTFEAVPMLCLELGVMPRGVNLETESLVIGIKSRPVLIPT